MRWFIDLGAFKKISITERIWLRFEATALNALNHPALGLPVTNISAGNVSSIVSTDSSENGDGRKLQLGIRLSF
jgi:hypothetical protein